MLSRAQFEGVLRGLLSQDNATRSQAEAALGALKGTPELVTELIHQVSYHSAVDVRHVAAIMLRKSLGSQWEELPRDVQADAKLSLMRQVFQESIPGVRRAIVDAIAAMAHRCVTNGTWPELLPGLQEMASAEVAGQRESALALFRALVETIPDVLAPHFAALKDVFVRGLQDADSDVRFGSVQAFGSLLTLAPPDGSATLALRAAVPLVIANLDRYVEETDDDALTAGVSVLLEVVEAPAPLLVGALPATVSVAMRGAGCQDLSGDVRAHCLQIVVWLATYKPKQLAKCGAMPELMQQLCTIAAEEGPQDYDAEADGASPSRCAVETIDEVALKLPVKHVLPTVLSFVESAASGGAGPGLLRGALRALGTVAEGCADSLRKSKKLPALLQFVLTCLSAGDARVRASAAVCLGHLASHLQPAMSEASGIILPPLFTQLQSESDARAVEAMVYAADSCMERLDASTAAEALPALMPPLLKLLEHGARDMHDSLLSCVSSAAAASEAAFGPYAGPVMVLLQRYMTLTELKDMPARSAATECVGHVVECLGKEAAKQLLPPFLDAALAGFQLDSPQLKEYGHGLLSQGAHLLEEDFIHYLAPAVNVAFQSIEGADGFVSPTEGAGTLQLDSEQLVHVRTGVIDEKAAALCALGIYAEHLKGAFSPFLEKAISLCKALADFLHPDPQRQALEALPKMGIVAKAAWPSPTPDSLSPEAQHIFSIVLDQLMPVVAEEVERPVVSSAVTGLAQLCEEMPEGYLLCCKSDRAEPLVAITATVLSGQAHCQQLSEGEEDEEALEASLEAEEELQGAAADLLVALAHGLGAPAFAQAWEARLAAAFLLRLQPAKTSEELRGALLGNAAEMLERAGSALPHGHIVSLVPLLLAETSSDSAVNRQHAVFALGHLVHACRDAAAAHLEGVLLKGIRPLLSDKAPTVVDNACGALARAILTHAPLLPRSDVALGLVQALPLRKDMEEAGPVVSALALLANDPGITSDEGLHMRILQSLASCACLVGVDAGDQRRAAAALLTHHGFYAGRVEEAMRGLSAVQRQWIEALIK